MKAKIKSLESGSAVGTLNTAKGLKELAALSGGLKAQNTFISLEGQEAVRKACGGNGYLLNSGVARFATETAWTVTAEGDYVIMMLFSAKYLLKQIMSTLLKRKQNEGTTEYLNDLLKKGVKSLDDLCPVAQSSDDFLKVEFLLALFRFRALSAVSAMAKSVQGHIK
jgi:acyl-CoA oxidase